MWFKGEQGEIENPDLFAPCQSNLLAGFRWGFMQTLILLACFLISFRGHLVQRGLITGKREQGNGFF